MYVSASVAHSEVVYHGMALLGIHKGMLALWGEPWTGRFVFVDGNEILPFRGDVTDLWLLAKPAMHGDAVKVRRDRLGPKPRPETNTKHKTKGSVRRKSS